MKSGNLLKSIKASSLSRNPPGFDGVIFLILAVISLEINVPFILDQLDFHHAMPIFGNLTSIMVPGGTDSHPLVILGNAFVPLKLLIRTLTLAAVFLYFIFERANWSRRLRTTLILAVVVMHVVIPQMLIITARVSAGNHALAHDGGVIQMEEAMKMVIHGRNPYYETFEGTSLEHWRGFKNNVVYHLPYMPGSFLYSLPFYGIMKLIPGGYDQRLFYMLLLAAAIVAILKSVPDFSHRMIALTVFALNPLFTKFFMLGANDVTIMAGLLWAFYFLLHRKPRWGFLCLGAACATKQFAWFFVPFFLLYTYPIDPFRLRSWVRQIRENYRDFLPGIICFLVTVLPFLLWNPGSFYQDTFLYGSGGLPTSYPMQGMHGYGFATVLLFFRIVPDGSGKFPFLILQTLAVIPLLIFALKGITRDRSPFQVLFFPAIILGVFMYLSRYFHGNFVGFVLFWLVYAYCFRTGSEPERSGG